ncbi:MAG: UPF0016 domain-containing protein [Bdellovibrio sp.]|nr:MAG: UPF0016 domain-containing protein [Bdellovibrio sp.]
MMDLKLFVSTFALIFLAELPDKTAFAALLMATRGRPWPIFIGAALAFVVQSAVAVLFGNLLGKMPERWVHVGSGLLFLIFGTLEWKKSLQVEERETSQEVESRSLRDGLLKTVWSAFLMIFVAEWGDLTQLATATLAAQANSPITIFLSSTLALWTVTGLAVGLGSYMKNYVHEGRLQKAASIAFVLVGIYLLSRDLV